MDEKKEEEEKEKKTKIIKILQAIADSKNHKMTDGLTVIWLKGLRRLSIEEIDYGFDRYCDEYKGSFMPDVGLLREYCLTKESSSKIQEAELAFESAWRMLETSGGKTVFFKKPSIVATINELGGWLNFCLSETKNKPFIKKEFVSIYLAVMGQKHQQVYLKGRCFHQITSDPKTHWLIAFEGEFDEPKAIQLLVEEKQADRKVLNWIGNPQKLLEDKAKWEKKQINQ